MTGHLHPERGNKLSCQKGLKPVERHPLSKTGRGENPQGGPSLDKPPIPIEELKKKGLVAIRKCVAWKWEIRKAGDKECGSYSDSSVE